MQISSIYASSKFLPCYHLAILLLLPCYRLTSIPPVNRIQNFQLSYHLIWLYLTYTQHIPNIYPTYTQHIPNIYSTYTQHILNIYSTDTQHIPNIYPTYSLHIPCIYLAYIFPIPWHYFVFTKGIFCIKFVHYEFRTQNFQYSLIFHSCKKCQPDAK